MFLTDYLNAIEHLMADPVIGAKLKNFSCCISGIVATPFGDFLFTLTAPDERVRVSRDGGIVHYKVAPDS